MSANIVNVFKQANGGRLMSKLDEAINKVVDATRKCAGKSVMTLKIEVSPAARDVDFVGTDCLEIKGIVDVKLASPQLPASTFYVNREGVLSRSDPRQPSADDTVDNPAQKIREGLEQG